MSNYYQDYLKQKEHSLKITSKEMFDGLAKAGYTRAEAHYSGGGDEGWIEDVILFKGDEAHHEPHSYMAKADAPTIVPPTDLTELVRDFVYNALPGGWEINEGSSGTAKIDVAARKANFDHYDVIESTEHNPFEVTG